jgi:hypothetical protein
MTPAADNISLDTPLRLHDAVTLGFPAGGMTVSGLRREGRRGNLTIETIAGKQFTTLRAIEEMRQRCRDQAKDADSGSNRKHTTARASSSGAQTGSSKTDRVKSARAALEKTARELKERSLSISPASIESPESATVIRPKFSSSTS